mmetsp:Transcript_108338/g.209734  ORF Transcript_108338/g.209734 Transcript_108338/m.209734 type:complete len:404 (+) Transcript_108338:97-1308(+)
MAREVELSDLYSNQSSSGVQQLDASAERVVKAFYDAQLSRHRMERERLERSAASGGLVIPAKWNRQELYLDCSSRSQAMVASRRHLAKHPEWLRGPSRLNNVALCEHVALQHYIDVDLEDLSLPEAQRRAGDSFCGDGGNICEQMVLDAPRSTFVVEGETFDFASEFASDPNGPYVGTSEYDQLQRAFCDRLVSQVVRCLGGDPAPRLLRAVSTTMSQSGLANVERACELPQVAVCGGDQQVCYELIPKGLGAKCWDITLSVRKEGFEHCISFGPPESSANGKKQQDYEPMACGSECFLAKSCTVRFRVGLHGDDVEADVLELRNEFKLVDRHGRLLPGVFAQGQHGRWFSHHLVRGLASRLCAQCQGFCGMLSAGASGVAGRVCWKVRALLRAVARKGQETN